MLYMPVDLFSSYIEGRENAIDRNWNDLNQANRVEQGWLSNDAQGIKNQFSLDTYGDNISNSNATARVNQNKAVGSDLNTQIAVAGQPGSLMAAQSLSEYQGALANASRNNLPAIASNQAALQLGQSADDAARGNALLTYSQLVRPQQIQNELATAQNNQQALQVAADLMPLQTEVGVDNLRAQQRGLQAYQDGTLFPQQTMPGTSLPLNPGGPTAVPGSAQPTVADIWNVAGRLAPGQSVMVNGVLVSRDNTGLSYLNNGVRQYLPQPPASPPATVPWERR